MEIRTNKKKTLIVLGTDAFYVHEILYQVKEKS